MPLGDKLEVGWLNTLRGINFTGYQQVYVGLTTTQGTDTTAGLEPNDPDYQRQVITFSAPVQEDGKAVMKNDIEVTFPPASRAWDTVSYFTLFSAQTGGDILWHDVLVVPKTLEEADQVRYKPGELIVRLG